MDPAARQPVPEPPLAPLPARLREHWREFGARGLPLRLLAGLGVYREMPVYRVSLVDERPEVRTADPIETSVLDRRELAEYLEFRGEGSPYFALRNWRNGDTCWIARREGQMAACVWVACGRVWLSYLERHFPLATKEIYLYDAYTAPQWRGRRIFGVLGANVLANYENCGYQSSATIIFSYNARSIAGFARLGFRPAGKLGCYGLGPWRRSFGDPV